MTDNDAVMEKVNIDGNIIDFSMHSFAKKTHVDQWPSMDNDPQ